MPSKHHPPLEIRLRVLSAVDHAPGESIRARIGKFYDSDWEILRQEFILR